MVFIFRRLVPYLLILGFLGAVTEVVTSVLEKFLGRASGPIGSVSLVVFAFGITCVLLFVALLAISYLSLIGGRRRSGDEGHFEARSPMTVLPRDGNLSLGHLTEEPETLRNLKRFGRNLR